MGPSYQKLLIFSNYLDSEDSSVICQFRGSNDQFRITHLFNLYFQQMKSVFQFLSLLFCRNNVIGEYSEFVNTYGEQIINITQQISKFV